MGVDTKQDLLFQAQCRGRANWHMPQTLVQRLRERIGRSFPWVRSHGDRGLVPQSCSWFIDSSSSSMIGEWCWTRPIGTLEPYSIIKMIWPITNFRTWQHFPLVLRHVGRCDGWIYGIHLADHLSLWPERSYMEFFVCPKLWAKKLFTYLDWRKLYFFVSIPLGYIINFCLIRGPAVLKSYEIQCSTSNRDKVRVTKCSTSDRCKDRLTQCSTSDRG